MLLADPPRPRPLAALRHPKVRLAIVLAAALVAIVVFLTAGSPAPLSLVLPLRLPKVAALVLVAVAIAVSTVLFQTVVGNRILTPSLMGFDSLYVLIQSGTVFFFGASALHLAQAQVKWALEVAVMVLAVTALYRWLFFGRRRDLHLLVLVGIVLGTLFRSLSSFLQRMLDPTAFATLQDELFASFNVVDTSLLGISAVAIAGCFAALARIRRTFDVLALGQDIAIGLGIDHRRVVMRILVVVAVLTAVSTALVGPVAFFGLLVANLAYLLVGDRHALSVPTAAGLAVVALVGGQFLLERVFAFGTGLSIIIEFLGGIVFVALLISRGAR